MMKIFITGKISERGKGNTVSPEVAAKFAEAEKVIIEAGAEPINPIKLSEDLKNKYFMLDEPEPEYSDYLLECILTLNRKADAILILKDSHESNGSTIEVILARAKNLPAFIIKDGKLEKEI